MRKNLIAFLSLSISLVGCSGESNDSSSKSASPQKMSGIEVPCSHEYVQRWTKMDEKNNPIYYDAIKITFLVNFDEVDKEFNISKERPNYLSIPAIAYLKTKNGTETQLIDKVFYGYEDGKFVTQQAYFVKKFDPKTLDENPIIKCMVTG